jgi:type-F conjugative transfer system pilin assembly protein TrbC
MLYLVISLLFFLPILTLARAEDHKAWALQQQEKSQELIKKFRQDAQFFQKPSFPVKGCYAGQSQSCGKTQKPTKSKSNLYIFVSFSMPKKTLKALALEAQKHQGILVIRGLIDNSFLKTAQLLQEIEEGVILDPILFRKYKIKAVPTFVQESEAGTQQIAGNVTLAYALEKFKESTVKGEGE